MLEHVYFLRLWKCFQVCTHNTFSSEINNTTRSLKFALFVAQIYGHFVTLLDTSPGMVASQINDKLLQQKSQSPDWASLGVVLLANRGISLAPGNRASVSVEHWLVKNVQAEW